MTHRERLNLSRELVIWLYGSEAQKRDDPVCIEIHNLVTPPPYSTRPLCGNRCLSVRTPFFRQALVRRLLRNCAGDSPSRRCGMYMIPSALSDPSDAVLSNIL